jgi:hypothetical protein
VSLLRVGVVVALFALSVGANGQTPAGELDGETKLDVGNGVSIRHPKNWSVAVGEFRNATQLIATATRADPPRPLARTLVTSERFNNHAAAVRKLANIAAEVVATPEYRFIGGWPALERRYMAPLAEPGQRLGKPDKELKTRLTTAIAAGEVLVRLETVVFGETETATDRQLRDRTLEEAIAIGRSAIASKPG